jgi:hypothetical protein
VNLDDAQHGAFANEIGNDGQHSDGTEGNGEAAGDTPPQVGQTVKSQPGP